MANEITLKTKLLNHYDDKVIKDNLVLGTGEIAFQTVKVPLKSGGTTDAVLMKVGNNKTAFNELDYVAATAADVYAWAKQAGLSVTPEGEGNVVASVSWDSTNNTLKVVKTNAVTPDELKAVVDLIGTLPKTTDAKTIVEYIDKKTEGIATSGALTELGNKVTDIETAISKLDDTYATDIVLNAEITRAKEAEKANADAIAAIKDGATLDSFSDVEGALNNKVDKATGKSLVSDTEITKLAGVSAGANKVEKSSFNGMIKIDGTDVAVYNHPTKHRIDEVTGLQDALDGKVDKVTGKGLSTNDLTNALKTNYDAAYTHSQTAHAPAGAQANIIESVKVNGEALTITNKAVDVTVPTKVSDLVNDSAYLVANDIANKADKATTLAGYGIKDAYTKTETEGKIEGAINTFVSAYITSDGGAIDKLQEIADWIDNDQNGAADIIANVEANASGIKSINNTLNTYGDIVTHDASEFATAAEGLKSVTHGKGLVATFDKNALNVDFDSTFTFILDANIND